MTAEPDEQDQAEAFDETNITRDGAQIATSDMQRDVPDVTAMAEDAADDDVAAEAEWRDALDPPADPDLGDLDPAEARVDGEAIAAERNDRVGEPRTFADNSARVSDEDLQPDDFEGDGLAAGADDENLDTEAAGYDGDGRPVSGG